MSSDHPVQQAAAELSPAEARVAVLAIVGALAETMGRRRRRKFVSKLAAVAAAWSTIDPAGVVDLSIEERGPSLLQKRAAERVLQPAVDMLRREFEDCRPRHR